MKEYTAKELEGHRIRISCLPDIPVPTGNALVVTDLETGEVVKNVAIIQLFIVPREVVTAQITLYHVMEVHEDGSPRSKLRSERITVHNPELNLTAIVTEE